MAYQTYSMNTIQLGRETTAGTAVAATEKWRGPFAMIEDTRQRETVEEQVGLLVPATRQYDAWISAELSMPAAAMTYEQLPHLLEAGIKTATPTGAGPYVRAYSFPTGTTPNTIKTYTIQTGNVGASGDNQRMPYAFVSSMKFSGSIKDVWNMEATWMGQQSQTSALTSSIALLDVQECVFGSTSIYIDASGGTVGSTQLNGVLMAAEINISDTGIREVPTADGTNYYSFHKFAMPTIEFSFTFELENTENAVQNARTAFKADDIKLFQLTIPGGTSSVEFSWAGRYNSISSYSNDNGNTSVQLGGIATYSPTDSLFFEATVTNSRATL